MTRTPIGTPTKAQDTKRMRAKDLEHCITAAHVQMLGDFQRVFTLGELVTELGTDPRVVGRILGRMAKQGRVVKRPDGSYALTTQMQSNMSSSAPKSISENRGAIWLCMDRDHLRLGR